MWTVEKAKSIITEEVTLLWLRRDLRLADNTALYHALKDNNQVLPIFIFDTTILDKLSDRLDRRVEFIYEALKKLKQELEDIGASLCVMKGTPEEIFKVLRPKNIYVNADYEPYAIERDNRVKKIFQSKAIAFHSFKDHVIFEKDEVLKSDGAPYTIFTPYSKKWKALFSETQPKTYAAKEYVSKFIRTIPFEFPSLQEIGFEPTGTIFPERKIKTKTIENYHLTRNFPGQDHGTSRLSAHLRFGTISIRSIASLANQKNQTWLNELIWRDFYHSILWHFPHVEKKAFKPKYEKLEWRNDETEFGLWCEGKTGYPIVDAGMRELNTTGFMHNRVRMIVASFLTKHLLIDWRWGEAYFAKKLLDYDLAANNGGWQWAAGCGCDAAPYFRVFNPDLQTEKFDPDRKYIRKWIPELDSPIYPSPIVDHKVARERVLKVYKKALYPN
jgi:deoxyribodipyrimidine photo-lyase